MEKDPNTSNKNSTAPWTRVNGPKHERKINKTKIFQKRLSPYKHKGAQEKKTLTE